MPPKGLPRVKRAAKPSDAPPKSKDIATMFSSSSTRAKKPAPKPAKEDAIGTSEDEQSDELLETPYAERPPSPSKQSRGKSKRTSGDENRSAEDESVVADWMEVDTSLPDPEAPAADDSDPLSALDAKYTWLLDEITKAPEPEPQKKPKMRKSETMDRLTLLDAMAKESQKDKQLEEERAKEKRRAAEISKKLHRPTPSVAAVIASTAPPPAAAPAATGAQARAPKNSRRSTRSKDKDAMDEDYDDTASQEGSEFSGGDEEQSSSHHEDEIVDYKSGALDEILEQQLEGAEEDQTVYNEETAREAEEELRRIETGHENMADTLAALTQDPLTRTVGRRLLATQGAETDAAPREMRFLTFKRAPTAVDVSALKMHHLPIDIGAPMLETLADCIADGVFSRICEKKLPSSQFLNFVVELLALYDADTNNFEHGESSLTFPLSLEEALLDKRDDDYESCYRALQATRRFMVVSQACKTLQVCFESHKETLDWKYSWASVKLLLDYFGMNSENLSDPIAALRLDITAYLNDLDKKKKLTEEDLIEGAGKDEDAMDVDTDTPPASGASQVKLKKAKKHSQSRSGPQPFPKVNWSFFMNFLHLLMKHDRLSITEAEQKHLLLILMRCLVDSNHEALDAFEHIQNCTITLVRQICAGNTTPVDLAVFVAQSLMPTQGETKAHAICRSWINRLVVDPADENTAIFRCTLAFAFAHLLMSRAFNAVTFVTPLGPSLQQIRTFFEQTHQPDERRPDLYWTLKSVLWLGMACIRFDATETFTHREVLRGIEKCLENLNHNIKEKASAPIGLTLCKETALFFSKLLSMVMSAHAPKSGMVKLEHMFQHQQKQNRRGSGQGNGPSGSS